MPRFLPSFGGAPLPLSWVSLGDSGRWVVQAPALFLGLTLGSSLSLPVLAAGLRWFRLSSLRSFAMEVVTLVLCQALVGLPAWHCCASGLLGPVMFLVFMLGLLSQVRSVFFLSPRS